MHVSSVDEDHSRESSARLRPSSCTSLISTPGLTGAMCVYVCVKYFFVD